MTRDLREPRRSFVGAFYLAYRNSSGSLAMFAAIRLASPQYPPVEDHAVCASATIPTPIERVVMSALCHKRTYAVPGFNADLQLAGRIETTRRRVHYPVLR